MVDADGNQIGDVMQKATIADSGTPALNPVKPKATMVKKGENAPTINSVALFFSTHQPKYPPIYQKCAVPKNSTS